MESVNSLCRNAGFHQRLACWKEQQTEIQLCLHSPPSYSSGCVFIGTTLRCSVSPSPLPPVPPPLHQMCTTTTCLIPVGLGMFVPAMLLKVSRLLQWQSSSAGASCSPRKEHERKLRTAPCSVVHSRQDPAALWAGACTMLEGLWCQAVLEKEQPHTGSSISLHLK